MLNKIILIASIAWSFCNAANGGAMIGDFSPMKVGNTWVYSELSYYESVPSGFKHDSLLSQKTITIISMDRHGDSLFYTIVDSTVQQNSPFYTPITNTKNYLSLNNNNFIYDTTLKKYSPAENFSTTGGDDNDVFCNFHELPDSNLTKVDFLSQSLFSYSVKANSPITAYRYYYYNCQWIQNFGLVFYSKLYNGEMVNSEPITELTLVSFNNQLVEIKTSKMMDRSVSENQIVSIDIRHQIHWLGASAKDRLNAQVFDFKGRLIYSSRQLPGSFVLNTSRFSRGAYVLRYQINNETWKNFSFVRN